MIAPSQRPRGSIRLRPATAALIHDHRCYANAKSGQQSMSAININRQGSMHTAGLCLSAGCSIYLAAARLTKYIRLSIRVRVYTSCYITITCSNTICSLHAARPSCIALPLLSAVLLQQTTYVHVCAYVPAIYTCILCREYNTIYLFRDGSTKQPTH